MAGTANPFRALSGLLLLRPSSAGRMLMVGALFLTVVFVALLVFGSSRSFLVEAKTGQIEITFGEGANDWNLTRAVLCRGVVPNRTPDPVCGSIGMAEEETGLRVVSWPVGSRVVVDRVRGGMLRITLDAGPPAGYDAGDAFVVGVDALPVIGALAFRGTAVLGVDMASGARDYLVSGRWEAREAGAVTSLLRSVTEVVKTGTFAPGAKVAVVRGDGSAAGVFGHLAPAAGENLLDVAMLSELGHTALSVHRFGLSEPALIEPDWVDIAISSPLLLAIAALFSILASVTQVFTGTAPRNAERGKEEK